MDAIIFDVGGVLVSGSVADLLAPLARTSTVPLELLSDYATCHRTMVDLGIWSEERFWSGVHETAGIAYQHTSTNLKPLLQLDEETLAVVARVQSAGIRVAVLTNDSKELAYARRSRIQERIVLPDPYLISAEEEVAKPSPLLFRRIQERLDIPARRIAFVDDSVKNCAGAHHVGMYAIEFKNVAQLRQELRGLGLRL